MPDSTTDIVDDPMESMDPLDSPPNITPTRKRPLWFHDTLQDVDSDAPIRIPFRERKKPCRYHGYVAAMTTMIQAKPSTFEEYIKEQFWKDSMDEEYESIMKNDVWDFLPIPKNKSMVTSKWILKIKHGIDGSIEKYKVRFIARGFSKKEGEYYDDIIHHNIKIQPWLNIQPFIQ